MSKPAARRSLAGSFRIGATEAPPTRASALVGLLPPRPVKEREHDRAESRQEQRELPPEPSTLRPVAPPTDEVPTSPQQEEQRSADGDGAGLPDEAVRGVAVYLPVELLERLRRTARSRDLTYSDLLVEAADAHLEEARASFANPTVRKMSGMPARQSRRTREPGVQVQLRLDGHQVRWLEEQVAALAAPSRTALVVALLRAHLGGTSAP